MRKSLERVANLFIYKITIMIVYRTDSRDPNTIQNARGFYARQPMSIVNARRHLLDFCTAPQSPLDLSRLIIGSPQPNYVSTDPKTDCGGYDKGFFYQISVDNLEEKDWSAAVLGIANNLLVKPIWPKLFLNADTLADATIIALKHYGNPTKEVTFLTEIPLLNIIAYKSSKDKDFVLMPLN